MQTHVSTQPPWLGAFAASPVRGQALNNRGDRRPGQGL
jgi:hypothetical protein